MLIETESRPIFLSFDTFRDLDELRRFRHVVRNIYTYKLDAQKVLILANLLPICYENLRQDYLSFRQVLDETA